MKAISSKNLLDKVERMGNKLPQPAILFLWLTFAVLVLSAIAALVGVEATHPVTQQKVTAINLLNASGIQKILSNTVSNFINFAPVGSVLVAILGMGVAEHSGLIGTLLRAMVRRIPDKFLSFTIVLAGVLSSIAMDVGYVILIPLAALIFKSAGRNPLIGVAAAFAGVSGGFSANLLIGPVDVILSGLSQEASRLVDPNYTVTPAANYYFIFISTFVVSILGAWITEKFVAPRFPGPKEAVVESFDISPEERKGVVAVGIFTLLYMAVLLLALIPENGILRNPETGEIIRSPFMSGIVVIIALHAATAGFIYGRVSGQYSSANDLVEGMEKSYTALAGYLVLMFFASQFVSYFGWSNLGAILAIKGAELLQLINLHESVLIIGFVFLAAFINLFIGSASAKWALVAPIFVPMFMLVGVAPEATQAAYRIGDSSTNIITPLMPYFGVVIAFAQQHQKQAGVGTVISMMLPYSATFLIGWSIFLGIWILAGMPLGPGVESLLPN